MIVNRNDRPWAGVYILRNDKGEVVYVGQSENVPVRMREHNSRKGAHISNADWDSWTTAEIQWMPNASKRVRSKVEVDTAAKHGRRVKYTRNMVGEPNFDSPQNAAMSSDFYLVALGFSNGGYSELKEAFRVVIRNAGVAFNHQSIAARRRLVTKITGQKPGMTHTAAHKEWAGVEPKDITASARRQEKFDFLGWTGLEYQKRWATDMKVPTKNCNFFVSKSHIQMPLLGQER